jgi:hypothetical protein
MPRPKSTRTKKPVTVAIPPELEELLDKRSGRLEWSKNKFLGCIIHKWVMDGAPPVAALDEAILKLDDQDPLYGIDFSSGCDKGN